MPFAGSLSAYAQAPAPKALVRMLGAPHVPFGPPWGSVVAIDMSRGEHRWRAPVGTGPRNHPALALAVKPGGHVVVGEPYWRRLPLPEDYEDRNEPWTTLEGTVAVFETSGLPVVSVIAASEDDWDRYETLHWQAVEQWLAANPGDPDAEEIRSRHERYKRNYLRYQREHLGWAIFVGWKRP